MTRRVNDVLQRKVMADANVEAKIRSVRVWFGVPEMNNEELERRIR